MDLPAVHHELVHGPGASRGWGLALSCGKHPHHLHVGLGGEGTLAHAPDLKENHAVAPHIAIRGIFLIQQGLM